MSEIDKLLSRPDQRDVNVRIVVLASELGDLIKSARYYSYYGTDGATITAYRNRLETDLADLYAQLMVLSRFFNFYIEDIEKLGLERLKEYLEHEGFKGDK